MGLDLWMKMNSHFADFAICKVGKETLSLLKLLLRMQVLAQQLSGVLRSSLTPLEHFRKFPLKRRSGCCVVKSETR
jgi:hypothetical protein